VKLARKINVGGESPFAPHQRFVFEARYRAPYDARRTVHLFPSRKLRFTLNEYPRPFTFSAMPVLSIFLQGLRPASPAFCGA
jgi:hypothetical protein